MLTKLEQHYQSILLHKRVSGEIGDEIIKSALIYLSNELNATEVLSHGTSVHLKK
jgi:hypothetical protein